MSTRTLLRLILLLAFLGMGIFTISVNWPGDTNEVYVKDTHVIAGEDRVEHTATAERFEETASRPEVGTTTALASSEAVIEVIVAWQPSHQDDTGDRAWHEYIICGDIVDRTMTLTSRVRSIKCWDIDHGLTGTNNYRPSPTNTAAFDAEIASANAAGADYFIAIHNDGGAPSGILGECMPGDANSRQFLQLFMSELCSSTGLPSRGISEVRLYSLEPERNQAPVRVLLEIGDNVNNRSQLESPEFRQLIAQALAKVANGLPDN